MSAVNDTVVRMALAAMAADPASTLTVFQRQWIRALAGRTTPLALHERQRIKGPLLAWVTERMPRVYAIVAEQFREE